MNPKLLLLLFAWMPLFAHAWWDKSFTERRVVMLDTSVSGVEIAAPVANAVLPVRLHGGNFDFLAAAPDGRDLRFIAGDDKTPLKHYVEKYDPDSELAVVWVQMPQLAPKTAGQKFFLYYGNPNAQSTVADSATTHDAATQAVFHFGGGADKPRDASTNANHALTSLAVEKAGLLAEGGRFEGAFVRLAPSSSLKAAAGAALTVSGWIKPADVSPRAMLYRQGPVSLGLEGGRLVFSTGSPATIGGGQLRPNQWQHFAVAIGAGKATLYLDGAPVASDAARLPEMQAEVSIGEGLIGLMDEVQLAATERSPEWIKTAAAAQGIDTKLLSVKSDDTVEASEGHASYLGILIDNLTVDAWVVIAILIAMFFIALAVMVVKARMIGVVDKANREFLKYFRGARDVLAFEDHGRHGRSTLYRLYQAGLRETNKRADAHGRIELSGASIDAVKAAIDADLVRENHKLNAKMVLLTIAISGGPFLGLLGTVVGVMITFAAIAAAGDVNVNAIAPGIAAALLATVAGLAVAIPALFGYNYLASRIKNISADMQIFVDEFVTRIAESYSR